MRISNRSSFTPIGFTVAAIGAGNFLSAICIYELLTPYSAWPRLFHARHSSAVISHIPEGRQPHT